MTNTLEKLFEDTLKDLYNAEKQFLKAMPKLAKAATNADLKTAIYKHATQTEGHVERLSKIAEKLDIRPSGKVCKAAQGLVEEAEEHLEEVEEGPVLDAAIIVCAQKNEHYEICSYGTMIAWAEQLGYKDAISLLQATLDEEKETDESLSALAEQNVNAEAEGAAPESSKSSKASVK